MREVKKMNAVPEYVMTVLKTVRQAGFSTYLVGGAVRDIIMGRTPTDYDIASSALPEQIMSLFAHTIPTGIKHGTVTVMTDSGGIEITTFRSDGAYTDLRHPDSVSFVGDINEDLMRRDFTVNAIAFDGENTVDPTGGISDIKNRIIRAVGDPEKRFSEDALRILRCFRFASQLSFGIEPRTLDAAIKLSDTLQSVSIERITTETIKLLCGKDPSAASPLFLSGAMRRFGFPSSEVPAVLSRLTDEPPMRLAAMIYLTERERAEAGYAGNIKTGVGLRLSNAMVSEADALLELMTLGLPSSVKAIKQMLRLAEDERLVVTACRALCTLSELSAEDTDGLIRSIETVARSEEPYKISMLKIGGKELSDIGFSGKSIGIALCRLLDICIDRPEMNTEETLLGCAEKMKH